MGFGVAFLYGGEARILRLRRRPSRSDRRVHGCDRFAEIYACSFVLPQKIVPAAKDSRNHNYDHKRGNINFVAVLDRPMDGLLGCLNGGFAESVGLELTASLCAHKRPF